MPKKKTSKHLQFYMDCMHKGRMPRVGLCSCAVHEYIDESLLETFIPDNTLTTAFSFWASGRQNKNCFYVFTPLRQTIVLLMAALNNEL